MKKSEATRLNILQKAFELIYTNSCQTTSIDQIIATTQVTKGAFFYHFGSKEEMGLAIVNKILKPRLTQSFAEPFQKDENPVRAVYELIENLLMKNELMRVEYGRPAANLIQEENKRIRSFFSLTLVMSLLKSRRIFLSLS